MNERIVARSFGPLRDIDVTFKKVTLFIGDQGTGKSCLAKLFSMFKWLEKQLQTHQVPERYYQVYDRFKSKLCAYHKIDAFVNDETYICYTSKHYEFKYEAGHLAINRLSDEMYSLPKIMYVPAERSIVSTAENKPRLLKELPDSCETFFDEFVNAKVSNKNGYNLPFTNLRFEYDALNDASWIHGEDSLGEDYKVRLISASSGVQSALPLCLVSEYIAKKINEKEELKLDKSERARLEKTVNEIVENPGMSESIKQLLLKKLSASITYGCFINIAEEPELNLFPNSQLEVLQKLIALNNQATESMLVLTTHSPYTLAILNLFVMAAKVLARSGDNRQKVDEILPSACSLSPSSITAIALSTNGASSGVPIQSPTSDLISKNYLDDTSETIMKMFGALYRLYASEK